MNQPKEARIVDMMGPYGYERSRSCSAAKAARTGEIAGMTPPVHIAAGGRMAS